MRNSPYPFLAHAALTGHRCPYAPCTGTLTCVRHESYTLMGQEVTNAYPNVCDICSRHVLTEQEWRRLTKPRTAPAAS